MSGISAQIQRARRKVLSRFQTRLAYLGDGSGNIRASVGKVWVRFPASADSTGATTFSDKVKVNTGAGVSYFQYDGAPIRVGIDENGELTVKGPDEKLCRESGLDTRVLNAGTPETKFIKPKHLIPLMCRPVGLSGDSSTLVTVREAIYQDGYGDLYFYSGTNRQADKIDLDSYIPAAGYHRIAIVFFRQYDQSIQVFASTAKDIDTDIAFTDFTDAMLQSTIDEDIPLAAYLLADDQSAITIQSFAEDLRTWLNVQPRFGEENPVHHNRYLRSGQTQTLSGAITITDGYTVTIDGTLIINDTEETVVHYAGASFGDLNAGNYSTFESDGTLRFEGDATVYNDLQFSISGAKVPAANFPDWEQFTTNTFEYGFGVNEYIDCYANEVPHSWELGSAADIHLHITTKAANSTGGNRFAKFTVYIAYAQTGGTWAETSFTAELTIPDGTAALEMFYLDMGDLDLTGFGLSTEIKPRVKRIAATGGTEYSGNIFITQLGAHLKDDTTGSREEAAK